MQQWQQPQTRGRLPIELIGLLGALVLSASVQANELQAYAGAVAGQASGIGAFACATSGPTIGNGWFAGITLPIEGFAGCHLAGGIDNQLAAGGSLLATQSASAALGNGSFNGQALARADYGRLGVAASGTMTGSTSSFSYHEAAGFARFEDTLTLHAPGVAAGTTGSVNFAFLIDGLMNNSPNPPYSQQADVALGIRVNGAPGGIWYSFMGTVNGNGMPYLRGGSSGLPGGFVSGPGSFAGAAEVTSTADFQFLWDVPFTLEVGFTTIVRPCCLGATMSADFSQTALLTGILARAGGQAVADFTVESASGTGYGPGGLLPVPEPGSVWLMLAGVALLAGAQRLFSPRAFQPSKPSFSKVAILFSKMASVSGMVSTARSMLLSRSRCRVG